MATILLVEDNALNRDMLSRRLTRRGFAVLTAPDGKQGHDTACSQMPDLILMDIGLPDMDGWQITQKLKSNAATREIPIIALTAHALLTDREKAREVGCDDYDTKPVDFARLLQKIEQLLVARGVL
jgi:two-component system, cell cycle response regulator DivK